MQFQNSRLFQISLWFGTWTPRTIRSSAEIEAAKAKKGIDALLKDFPPKHVALYMCIFQMQKEGGWPGLTDAIAGYPDLQLQPPV